MILVLIEMNFNDRVPRYSPLYFFEIKGKPQQLNKAIYTSN